MDLLTPVFILLGGIGIGAVIGFYFAKAKYMEKYWRARRDYDVQKIQAA